MGKREPLDEDLDAGFAALRAQAPRPGGALMGRVMADAAREMPRRPVARWRLWLGDWGVGVPVGLAASLFLGLWIGVAAPGPLAPLDAVLWGDAVWAALADPGADPGLELAQ